MISETLINKYCMKQKNIIFGNYDIVNFMYSCCFKYFYV